MDKYIGVKMLEAEPTTLGNYNILRGWDIPKDEDPEREGYLVVYPDGYKSWSPKEAFESAYFKIQGENKIVNDDVNNFIKQTDSMKIGEKTTLATTKLVNGFDLIETSSCVDPSNYNQEIGRDICLKKNKDKLWMLLGFVLQWALTGIQEVVD